ncbi:MAG: poly(A) polymerase [Cyanobacteria bacterium P01_F01_bin.143]
MATSREVYHRIIWDSRLDRNVFISGFQDRISSNGIIEKPLAHWAVNGDIPWHRIRYIRCKDIVVWDREQHLDLISTGHLPAFAWKNNQEDKNVLSIEEKPAIFDKRLVYKYDNQDWQPTEDLSNIIKSKSVKLNSLTIASFNVLCNLYEKSKIKTEKRLPAIIKHLYQCDSDIIAIQEATPALVELLLSQDWVRDYYVSSSITAETIQPFGNLLLSRFPFTLVEHQFSPHKQVLVGSWFINDELLQVGVVHLTSNRAQNAAEKRKYQLTTLLNYLQKQSGNCLIVGDFNTRDNSLEEILTGNNFIDIWQELRPDEAGYTFNPQLNPLAELMSLEGEAARFDRILLHSPNGNLVPDSVNLFACEPVDNTENNIFPSDHFGIRAVITSPRANLENEELQQIYGVSLNKVKPQPFEVRRIINFGEEETILASPELIELVNQLEPKLNQAQQIQRETVLEIITQACKECLGFQPSLQLLGSYRLGVQSPESDLDVVCQIPTYLSGETFLKNVQQILEGLCETIQLVLDAKVPLLRLKLDGISLDLLYAPVDENWGLGIGHGALGINKLINSQSDMAIIGCWEADLIAESVRKYVQFDSFCLLLRAVRGWAKSRRIYGNAWGFLGGFSWALLSAWSCQYSDDYNTPVDKLLANLFQLLKQHNWNQPIALTDVGKQYSVQLPRDFFPIITSIEPCQNTARNITRSTAEILRCEFVRGTELTQKINTNNLNWSSLFEPINLQQESDIFLVLIAIINDNQELEKYCGILEGYIISLIIQLELLGIFVRPWTGIDRIDNTAHITLGLNLPSNCKISLIKELAQDFVLQFSNNFEIKIVENL